ncbi:methyltransferase, FxLD system [Natronosporangium hydrolyticum]|uniref:Protein-L-isoaspartate O-methyltransferase n=2 Tax=Natronosporangium hydrolyticum TaxID=2811111 RepID=A0A895YI27_9ACTN|nr:methyltransferase, FxLD system [Natronosporangium hydrolyticum]
MIRSEAVEAAFRRVPRHLFVPAGTSIEEAYSADAAPPTKKDVEGQIISSVSAPFLQAQMLEQAQLHPGASVLEIGSGGYNAALIAEVVGPAGRVVSVDIDPDVTAWAREALDASGYGNRVETVCADAEHGLAGSSVFDAIIVTVGAWDIPPAWLTQLDHDGTLSVPLRMNGVTRSIAFARQADHLASTSAEVCGFVPMQGLGERRERVLQLPDGHGRYVRLRFDTGAPEDPNLLDGVLADMKVRVWSGVEFPNGVSFADLHLWNACFLPGFCKVAADEGTELAQDRKSWFPFGCVFIDSFAYLAVRPAMDGAGIEFGAGAYGPNGEQAAAAMVEQIQAWDRRARRGPVPTFGFWPDGSDRSHIPDHVALLEKHHGLVTVSWPRASRP